MLSLVRHWVMMPVFAAGAAAVAVVTGTQPSQRDGIGDLIKRTDTGTQVVQAQAAPSAPHSKGAAGKRTDSDRQRASSRGRGGPRCRRQQRAGAAPDEGGRRPAAGRRQEPRRSAQAADGKRLHRAADLDRDARGSPTKIRELLDAALGVVTDVPVVDLQKKIDGLRRNIREHDDRIVRLREKQLVAPKDGMLPGYVTDTVDSLGKDIDETKKRIDLNRAEIAKTKAEVHEALKKAGIQLSPEQVDLLLDSVLSGDLVRLVAVFNSAKLIDGQLGKLMTASGENIGAARKYFAMHAALFALLVHSQDLLIDKIDKQYLPKLSEIEVDIRKARAKTAELLKLENREDQKRALEGNRESQRLAEDAAKGYRRYLLQQREQIAKARQRATHDLRIADNTFETVEASYQLRNLMRDAAASFEAIQKLEAPTFDQIFKNEELRREFENLTRKLDGPTS